MKIVLETGFCLRDSWWLETFRYGVITKHNQLRVVRGYVRGKFLFWIEHGIDFFFFFKLGKWVDNLFLKKKKIITG